ncbi:MAG TPA: hypothetical protein V6C89_13880 [Drouetiella sp.]|jgi:hypothetical protein
MKRLAIALILIAAAPAVVTASSSLLSEVTGRNELVAESMPSTETDLTGSAKSSRPQSHYRYTNSVTQPMDSKLSAGWL